MRKVWHPVFMSDYLRGAALLMEVCRRRQIPRTRLAPSGYTCQDGCQVEPTAMMMRVSTPQIDQTDPGVTGPRCNHVNCSFVMHLSEKHRLLSAIVAKRRRHFAPDRIIR